MLTTLEQLEISLQAIIKHINKVLPKKLSELQNDTGYLTDYTETDPTVPAWAKAATKPTYTAAEVGALSDDTVIPSKVSQLTNDAGFTTKNYVDTAVSSVESPPEIYIGSTTPSGYTLYIDPDGMVESAKGVSF